MKRLQLLRDKLGMQKEDIEYTEKLLADEQREMLATQEQVAVVAAQVRVALDGLGKIVKAEPTHAAAAADFDREGEALRHSFGTILSHAIKDLRSDPQKQKLDEALAAPKDESLKEISVMYEDEEAVFRVNEAYNFESLREDACRYFEVRRSACASAGWSDGPRSVRSGRVVHVESGAHLLQGREDDRLGDALLQGEQLAPPRRSDSTRCHVDDCC